MSKTVLLPDELHSKIQESKIMIDWVEVTMSLAKKIELYFDSYKFKISSMNSDCKLYKDMDSMKNSENWILIEDTIPEPFKEVLVVSNDFPPTIGYYNNRSNLWHLISREDHIEWLTHWMKLPLHPLNF